MLPSVQVASPPATQAVCPCVQLSLQVSEHAALGAVPPQVWGAAHVRKEATYKQSLASDAHVAIVWPS